MIKAHYAALASAGLAGSIAGCHEAPEDLRAALPNTRLVEVLWARYNPAAETSGETVRGVGRQGHRSRPVGGTVYRCVTIPPRQELNAPPPIAYSSQNFRFVL